jgi:hypothetical protein
MNRFFFPFRPTLFVLLLSLFVLFPVRASAQQEDDEDDADVDTITIVKPRIKKFQYRFQNEPGHPVEIMTGDPLELGDYEGMSGLDSAYKNAIRVYVKAARPFIDMMRSEEDLDFLGLMDTTANMKYKEIPELERKSFELSRAWHDASKPNARETVEKELQTTLNKLFDLREQRKEDEVKRIEADLAKTKAKMTERQLKKEHIVKRRLDQLLGKRDDLEW